MSVDSHYMLKVTFQGLIVAHFYVMPKLNKLASLRANFDFFKMKVIITRV